MPAIGLHQVKKAYQIGGRELVVLKGINLTIDHGEFVAIVGPSGSGKTTLLHLLGALDKPTAGTVVINDQDISSLSDEQLAMVRNKTLGFVFQNFHLLSYYTALENVKLPLIYAGTHQDRSADALNLLTHVGLGERADHKPNELSGGERQRVAIARALINNPRIVCADEPTGNLDSKSGEVVMNYLKEINRTGTTVILITHDHHVAQQANRLIQIQDGEVV